MCDSLPRQHPQPPIIRAPAPRPGLWILVDHGVNGFRSSQLRQRDNKSSRPMDWRLVIKMATYTTVFPNHNPSICPQIGGLDAGKVFLMIRTSLLIRWIICVYGLPDVGP